MTQECNSWECYLIEQKRKEEDVLVFPSVKNQFSFRFWLTLTSLVFLLATSLSANTVDDFISSNNRITSSLVIDSNELIQQVDNNKIGHNLDVFDQISFDENNYWRQVEFLDILPLVNCQNSKAFTHTNSDETLLAPVNTDCNIKIHKNLFVLKDLLINKQFASCSFEVKLMAIVNRIIQ